MNRTKHAVQRDGPDNLWRILVRQRIDHDVYAHRVRFLEHELSIIILVFAFPLPTIGQIRIVTEDGHQPPFIVLQPEVMGLFAILPLPCDACAQIPQGDPNHGHLWLFVDAVEGVEDRMIKAKLDWFAVGKNPFDFCVEMPPFLLPPRNRQP